jgi:hypothetical protein
VLNLLEPLDCTGLGSSAVRLHPVARRDGNSGVIEGDWPWCSSSALRMACWLAARDVGSPVTVDKILLLRCATAALPISIMLCMDAVSRIYGEVSGERVFTRQTRRRTPGTAKTLEAPYLGRRTGKHISTGFGSTMSRAMKAVQQKLRLKPAPSMAMLDIDAYAEELTSVFGFSFPLPPVYLNARPDSGIYSHNNLSSETVTPARYAALSSSDVSAPRIGQARRVRFNIPVDHAQ